MITLINPGPGLVVYDEQGRSIGGGERLEVDALDPVAERALELKHLLRAEDVDSAEEPASSPPPDKAADKPAGRDDTATSKTDQAKPASPARRSEKS